jgi:hypothetical protein
MATSDVEEQMDGILRSWRSYLRFTRMFPVAILAVTVVFLIVLFWFTSDEWRPCMAFLLLSIFCLMVVFLWAFQVNKPKIERAIEIFPQIKEFMTHPKVKVKSVSSTPVQSTFKRSSASIKFRIRAKRLPRIFTIAIPVYTVFPMKREDRYPILNSVNISTKYSGRPIILAGKGFVYSDDEDAANVVEEIIKKRAKREGDLDIGVERIATGQEESYGFERRYAQSVITAAVPLKFLTVKRMVKGFLLLKDISTTFYGQRKKTTLGPTDFLEHPFEEQSILTFSFCEKCRRIIKVMPKGRIRKRDPCPRCGQNTEPYYLPQYPRTLKDADPGSKSIDEEE